LVFCTAMSFSPGPNTTLSTALAANHGLRRPALLPGGAHRLDVLLMLACGLGLGALITRRAGAALGVKLLGVGYMLWLAWKLSGAAASWPRSTPRLSVGVLAGRGLQFLNIKAWMLALTLTAGWVVNAPASPPNPGERLAIICAVMVVFAFTSNFTYALVGSLLRQWLAQGRRLLWFNRMLALVLLLTAAWMLTV
jgi:threonine/homoserine/homoserine lactone efflux protein